MSTKTVYPRIKHRETTSPRATLAIILAVIIILAIAYAVTETILSMSGQPPLIAAPADMGSALVDVPTYASGGLIAAGIVAVIIGLILMVMAVKAGRRPRHVVATERVVTVVDDEVIASAIARHAAYEGNVDPDNARVSVSKRRALVRLTPASGTSIEAASVNDVATKQLDAYELQPSVKSRVVIEEGKVGA